MAQHGGSISAENRVDGGARFMLRFPKYDAEAVKA
jgi:signal transduction histidine kinase